jgi:hypothetical protein
MGTATFRRNDVVYFVGGNEKPGLQAFLAERMLGDVYIADGTPAAAIDLVAAGSALVFVILPRGESLVSVAIAPAADERRAAGIGAGMFSAKRHDKTSKDDPEPIERIFFGFIYF